MEKLKLNLLTHKDYLKPAMEYIQIKEGFVNVCSPWMAFHIPIEKVFDREEIEQIAGREFYIHAEDWKEMLKGTCVVFKTELVEIVSNKSRNKVVKLFRKEETNFVNYPQVEAVIPVIDKPYNLSKIHLNAKLLYDAQQAFGPESSGLEILFGEKFSTLLRITKSDGTEYAGVFMLKEAL